MKPYLTLLSFLISGVIVAQDIHPTKVFDSFSNVHDPIKLIVETNKSAYGKSEKMVVNVSALSFKDNHVITQDVNVKLHFYQLNGSYHDSFIVKVVNGSFSFEHKLDCQSGVFMIRARTLKDEINGNNIWSDAYFQVYHQYAESVNWDFKFDQLFYSLNDVVTLKVKIFHSTSIPLKYWEIQKKLLINGVVVQAEMDTTDSDASVQIKLDLNQFKKNDVIRFYFRIVMGEHQFEKYIRIPMVQRVARMDFYPESGQLVAGYDNKVVFRGFDEKGDPISFKGMVLDEANRQFTLIQSDDLGSGELMLHPSSKSTYKAVVFNDHNDTQFFHLPIVSLDGVGLHIESTDSVSIRFKVFNMPEEGLKLMVRYGDKLVEIKKLFGNDQFQLDISAYKMGIHQLLLFSDDWRYICSRSVFLRPDNRLKINVQFNQLRYAIGDTVRMKIRTTDEKGNPVKARIRLNVLAGKGHEKVLPKSSLMSKVLLENELDFPLIEPARYLEPSMVSELDRLMLCEKPMRMNFVEMNQYLINVLQTSILKSDISYVAAGRLFDKNVSNEFKKNIKLVCLNNGKEIPVDSTGKFAIYGLRKDEMLKFKAKSGSVYEYFFEVKPWQIIDLEEFKMNAFCYRDSMSLYPSINYLKSSFAASAFETIVPDTFIDEMALESNGNTICSLPEFNRILSHYKGIQPNIRLNAIGDHVYGYRTSINVENPFDFCARTDNKLNSVSMQQAILRPDDWNGRCVDFNYTQYHQSRLMTNDEGVVQLEFVCNKKEMIANTCLIDVLSDQGEMGQLKFSIQVFQPFQIRKISNPILRVQNVYQLPIEIYAIDSTIKTIAVNFPDRLKGMVSVLNVEESSTYKSVYNLVLNEDIDYFNGFIEFSVGNYVSQHFIRLHSQNVASGYARELSQVETPYPVFVKKIIEGDENGIKNHLYVYNAYRHFGYSYQTTFKGSSDVRFNSFKLPFLGLNLSDSTLKNLSMLITVEDEFDFMSFNVKSDGISSIESYQNRIIVRFLPIPPKSSVCANIPIYIFGSSDMFKFNIESLQ